MSSTYYRLNTGKRAEHLRLFSLFVLLSLVLINACSNSSDKFSIVEVSPVEGGPENISRASFTALVGETGSTVTFSEESANNYEFYRSREEECDLGNYTACEAGQFDVLGGAAVSDTALTLANDAYFALLNGEVRSSDAFVTRSHFSKREQHQVVEFNDKLWLIGYGGVRGSRFGSDVWSSNDGVAWREETPDSGVPARANYQAAVFDGKIWLIGGVSDPLNNTGYLNDIWSSEDGVNWTLEVASGDFSGRQGHQLLVFNNRLWLLGGSGADGLLSDVWSTNNGVDWTQEVDEADFGGRSDFQSLVFDQRLWVIAGEGIGGDLNDVWSSSDGVSWAETNNSANFSPRTRHQSTVFENRIWLVAGNNTQSDVWSSSDGIEWVLEEAEAGFTPREEFQLTVFNGSLWVIGGGQHSSNDIWVSSTGTSWTRRTNNLALPDAALRNTIVFDGQLWAVSVGSSHSVWRSENGIEWVLVTASAPISSDETTFTRHHLVVFQNRLWAIARESVNNRVSAWSTANGNEWRLETDDIPVLAANSSHLLVFLDQLWLVVPDNDGMYALVSTDGINWQEIPERWALPNRLGAGMIVYNDRMWLIAGFSLTTQPGGTSFPDAMADVWSTSDGMSWTQEAENAEFGPRYFHAVLAFDQKLWVSGSAGAMNFEPEADHWSSTDGVNWTLEFMAPYFSRGNPIHVLNDSIFTSAGPYLQDQSAWFYSENDEWRKGVKGTIVFP